MRDQKPRADNRGGQAMNRLRRYACEDGAVSPEFVVLTALAVGITAALLLVLYDGPQSVSQLVGTALAEAELAPVELAPVD